MALHVQLYPARKYFLEILKRTLQNFLKIFPRYYIHSDVLSKFRISNLTQIEQNIQDNRKEMFSRQ